jgi:hypothetical protein
MKAGWNCRISRMIYRMKMICMMAGNMIYRVCICTRRMTGKMILWGIYKKRSCWRTDKTWNLKGNWRKSFYKKKRFFFLNKKRVCMNLSCCSVKNRMRNRSLRN